MSAWVSGSQQAQFGFLAAVENCWEAEETSKERSSSLLRTKEESRGFPNTLHLHALQCTSKERSTTADLLVLEE